MANASLPSVNIQVDLPIGIYIPNQQTNSALIDSLNRFLQCTVSMTKLDGYNFTITRLISYNRKSITLSCPAICSAQVVNVIS